MDPAPSAPIILCGSPVDSVESCRFLGTIITQDLKWELNIRSLTKKGQQRIFFLRQLKKFNLPKTMMVHFYTAIIESILTSSITVWYTAATATDKSKLQRIIRSAEKVIGCNLPSLHDPAQLQGSEAGRQDYGRPLPSWSQFICNSPLWQEAAVHQDQNLPPLEQFLPLFSWVP